MISALECKYTLLVKHLYHTSLNTTHFRCVLRALGVTETATLNTSLNLVTFIDIPKHLASVWSSYQPPRAAPTVAAQEPTVGD